jgi:hypothetical protein
MAGSGVELVIADALDDNLVDTDARNHQASYRSSSDQLGWSDRAASQRSCQCDLALRLGRLPCGSRLRCAVIA